MQRVYKIKPDVLRYQWLVLPGDGHLDRHIFDYFCGYPWPTSPPVEQLVRAPDEAFLPLGDFPNLDPSVLVVSDRAFSAMPEVWAESGQAKKVKCEAEMFYLFNAFAIPSLAESDISKQIVGGGGISTIFRPVDRPNGRPFVTDRFVSLYLKYDLRGLLFEELPLRIA